MACFNSNDLADFVRHQCINDDGRCKKILRPPSRKAKPGGLPLNFRSSADSDTSSGEYSPRYLATADFESTYELQQERLRLRIQENDLSILSNEVETVGSSAVLAPLNIPNSEFFQYEDASCIPSPLPVKKSTTALLLEKTDFMIRPDLAAYARFATSDIKKGRKLLVFYPFTELEPGYGKCFSLIVYAQREICISDLVGLCCYEYARCRRTNDIESVTQYHLLMADENGEVDRDLPAVDGHRLLSELGACWSTIALEKRQSLVVGITNVVVYIISGKKYEFHVDSLDIPLLWLRDQAVKKRIEDEGQEFMSDCPALREYVLEAVDRPNVMLDLSKPISSTACVEFLLLRINSSRGDFLPTNCSSSGQINDRVPKFNDKLMNSSVEQRQCSASSEVVKESLGNLTVFYPVEKICRYKPNWNALLVVRMDGFELAPDQSGRTRKWNSMIFYSSPKVLNVTWDYVGGVEITDRSNTKRLVKIIWLARPTIKQQSEECKSEKLQTSELDSITQDSSLSFESLRSAENHESWQKLCHNARWKILQLQADVDVAWSIGEKMSTIIDEINSAVHQIYKFSSGGTKKPKKAAAEAFVSNGCTQFKRRISPAVRRISHLTSAMTASTVPMLLKLWSKNN